MGDTISSCVSTSDSKKDKKKPSTTKKQRDYAVHEKEEESATPLHVPTKSKAAAAAEGTARVKPAVAAVTGFRHKLFSDDDAALLCLAQIGAETFCAGSEEGEVVLFSNNNTHSCKIRPHKNEVTHLKFHHQEPTADAAHHFPRTLFSASRDKTISILSVIVNQEDEEERPVMHLKQSGRLTGHTFGVTALDTINENLIVSGSRDNTVRLWDVSTQECCAEADVKLNIVHCVKWMPRLSVVAQGGEDLAIRLWDIRCNNANEHGSMLDLADELTGFDYHPICCDLLPDGVGHTIVVGHNGFNDCGSSVSFWDLRMKKMLRDCGGGGGHSNTVRRIVALPAAAGAAKGKKIAVVSGSDDGTMRMWSDGSSAGAKKAHDDDDDDDGSASFNVDSIRSGNPVMVPSRISALLPARSIVADYDFVAAFRDGEIAGWRVDFERQSLNKVQIFA